MTAPLPIYRLYYITALALDCCFKLFSHNAIFFTLLLFISTLFKQGTITVNNHQRSISTQTCYLWCTQARLVIEDVRSSSHADASSSKEASNNCHGVVEVCIPAWIEKAGKRLNLTTNNDSLFCRKNIWWSCISTYSWQDTQSSGFHGFVIAKIFY